MKISFREYLKFTVAAFKKSELSLHITFLHLVFFIGMFIEPLSGVTGFVLCILLQLLNLIIGLKELTKDELKDLSL